MIRFGRSERTGSFKKYVKMSVSAVLMLAFFMLCGCSANVAPAEQVEANIEKIKSEEISADLVNALSDDVDISSEYADQFKQLVIKMQDFEYSVKDTSIDEEEGTAVVTLTITTYDLGSAYEAAYDKVLLDAAEGRIDEETDIDKYVYDTLFDMLLKLDTKDRVTDVDINCVRNESGDWESDIETNAAFHDAWTGGLNTAINELRG